MPYVRDEIKRLGQRYADSMEGRPNPMKNATNPMKKVKIIRQLKRNVTGHVLFKTFINCQMYY